MSSANSRNLGETRGDKVTHWGIRGRGLGGIAQFISLYRQKGNPRGYPLKNK